jgi:hypothetical protein
MSRLAQLIKDADDYIKDSQYKKAFKLLNKVFMEIKVYFCDETETKLWMKCCRRMAYVC